MKEKIVLIGGGGHCRSCIDVIEEEDRFEIAGIVDTREKIGRMILGYTVFAADDELPKLVKEYSNYLITIGHIASPYKRIEKYESVKQLGGKFPVIVSPKAHVSKHASIGGASIVMHHAVINAGAVVGNNCIINTAAVVEHDVTVEDHCHISVMATLNGGTVVRRGTFVGSHAVTKEYIAVREGSFIKANTLVKASDE